MTCKSMKIKMNSASTECTCPICFETLDEKIKASPDNCEHIFCLPCLEKWSKLGSYCPVDRKRFKKILNLDHKDVIQVKPHKRKRKRTFYDFTTTCEECSGNKDANIMLLCDCCDLGYHIYCLSPPLKEVPSGLWFCPTCISVEEKLKKKNGITKEMEAEFGSFDKLLYENNFTEKIINEKESMVKPKKLDNSAPVIKNTSILEACHDIISGFEEMIVGKNCNKDASSSNYLDSTINKIDKIYKTFDIVSKNSNCEQSRGLKTYYMTNTHRKTKRIKRIDAEQIKKSYQKYNNASTNNMCLDETNMSSDIDLHYHTSTGNVPYGFLNADPLQDDHGENERANKNLNAVININQVKLYSETNDILSDECMENFPQRKYQELNSSIASTFEDKYGSMPVLEKCVDDTDTRLLQINTKEIAKKSPNKKTTEINKAMITSYTEDFALPSSCNRNKPPKGTSKNLIQFSVFQRVEGIDASQEICSQISAVDVPFSSDMRMKYCFICNAEFIAKSDIHCRLCKQKYFSTEKNKRFSNYVKNFKKGLGYKNYETINLHKVRLDSRLLGTHKYLKSNSFGVLERRKRSLVRTLKKIRDSKCSNNIPVKLAFDTL